MQIQERPRERALSQGISSLSNREVLAILLRSGTKDRSVLDIAEEILHMKADITSLMELQFQDLIKIHGIKAAKATQILACFELCKRISHDRMRKDLKKDAKPIIISDWLMNHIGSETQEHFIVVFLNNRGKLLAHKDLFIGTGNKSFANPREVFACALQQGCSKIICAHNHPSQDVTPSASDFISARSLEESGDMIGIKVVDHVIVSSHSYYSFKEHLQMLYQKEKVQKQFDSSEILFPQ